MNKRHLFLPLAVISLSLASCTDTSQLYDYRAFIGDDFVSTQYNVWDAGLKEAKINKSYTLSNYGVTSAGTPRFFAGSGNYDEPRSCSGFDQAKSIHPEKFGNLRWEPDINPQTPTGKWYDQSNLVGVAYGQTHKLGRVNDGFRRGFLSKLYDGQVRCNAWGSLSYVGLDKTGYGAFFPCELNNASYFAFSCRGGSDTRDSGVGRVVTMDINVTFYKMDGNSYSGTSFLLDDVKLQANRSAELTSLVGFYFEEVPDFSPAGIVGMSVTFDLVNDPYAEPVSDDFKTEGYHMGLLLLEVFFPDSNWN